MTFSDEEIPMEINCNNNVRTCRPFPFCLCVVNLRFVADTTYVVINEKRRYENKKKFCVSPFFVLLLFRKQILLIKSIWLFPDLYCLSRRKYFIFLKKKRKSYSEEVDAKVFRDNCISAIFSNRRNLKNLAVKTKVA